MAKKLIGSAALTPSSDTGFDLTTKGDTHGFSNQNARIPISTNNFSLLCDSAESLGLKWAASPTSVLSGVMDILYSSAANTLARLAAGTDGDVLTTHGTGSVPTWETPSSGGSASTAQVIITSGGHITTTSTSLVDATGLTLTLPNTGGTLDCICNQFVSVTSSEVESIAFALVKDTTAITYATVDPATVGSYDSGVLSCLVDGDGDTLKLQWKVASGNTATIRVTATWSTPTLSAFAV